MPNQREDIAPFYKPTYVTEAVQIQIRTKTSKKRQNHPTTYTHWSLSLEINHFIFILFFKFLFLVYEKKVFGSVNILKSINFVYFQVKFMIFNNTSTFLKCRQTSVTANCPWCVCNTLKIKQYNVINPITVYNL